MIFYIFSFIFYWNTIYCKILIILIIDCNNYVNIYSKYSYNTIVFFFFLPYKLLSLSISKYNDNNNSNVILAFFLFNLMIYCDVLIKSDFIKILLKKILLLLLLLLLLSLISLL